MDKGRKEYLYQYQKRNLKRVPLDLTKEKYIEVQSASKAAGESVNGYIKKAIDERMERDGDSPAPSEGSTPHDND